MTQPYFVPVPRELVRFLCGEGSIDGAWFGEDRPGRGRYWWRARLYDALNTPTSAPTPPPSSVKARGLVWTWKPRKVGDREIPEYVSDDYNVVREGEEKEWSAGYCGELISEHSCYTAAQAACQQHFDAYVRTLLVPVDEAAKVGGIHTPTACRHPNCNCEHGCVADSAPLTESAEAPVATEGEAVALDAAFQKLDAEWGLDSGSARAVFRELLPHWNRDPWEQRVWLSTDELILADDYGVPGSTFYECRLCGASSGAGLLNKGIEHLLSCPLHEGNYAAHTHPAPLPAVAGVTELREALRDLDLALKRIGDTMPIATTCVENAMVHIEAALGARNGE